MREKLLDLMKSEGLKPSQLAELLEINPAEFPIFSPDGTNRASICCRRFSGGSRGSIPTGCCSTPDKMYRDSKSEQSASATASESSISDGLFGPVRNTPSNPPHQEPTPAAPENSAPPDSRSVFRYTDRRRCPADRNIVRRPYLRELHADKALKSIARNIFTNIARTGR